MMSSIYTLIDRVLTYLRNETRWWVIFLIFLGVFTWTLKDSIYVAVVNYDPVKTQAEASEKINTELEKILNYANADRVYIFQFHNGVTYYDGRHAQRFTCTYEITREGVSREADNLKDLQVSVYSWFVNETIKGDMGYTDTDSIPDYTTRYSLHSQGIKSIRVLPIIKDNKVVGLIGMDYVMMSNPFLLDPIAKEWFEEEARRISELMIL